MIVELLTWDFRVVLQDYLAWTIGIAAILWGGGPERAVAVTWILLFELVPGAQNLIDPDLHFQAEVDVFYAVVDGLAAASFIAIALYANRNYTLWIAGMQVLAVAAHVASGIAEPISPVGYAVMVIAPGWMQLLLLTIGLIRHRIRKRKFGEYRDWRVTKPPQSFDAGPRDIGRFASLFQQGQASWRDEVK